MCVPILKGQQSEWAILRRHESEDIFGVQVIVTLLTFIIIIILTLPTFVKVISRKPLELQV